MQKGLHILGSRYSPTEVAGDGSTITAGSRVRYEPGSRSIFDYDQPQPQSGSVGTVSGDFHEFNKQMWATVAVDGQPNKLNPADGMWSIRTNDLRSLEAREKTAPAVQRNPRILARARHRTVVARLFFVAAAVVTLALVFSGGRS